MSRNPLKDFSFAVVVSDPRQRDNPILHVSSEFLTLTGYSSEEVLGRNCRFLQGPETERRHILEVRDALREERPCKVCLLNYNKSGEKFWNLLYVEPIFDESGTVTRHVGIQTNVTHLMNTTQGAPLESVTCFLVYLWELWCVVSGLPRDFGRIVEMEKTEAREVSRRLSEEGRASIIEKDACSILPSSILASLDRIHQSFVLVDPNLPDMPIVHAGDAFIKLTGYPKDQIIGRNCRFLQGPLTEQAEVEKIREAINADPPKPVTATLLNYRFNGTPFWNALHISPVRNANGQVAYLVGVQLNANEIQEDAEPLDKMPLPDVNEPLSREGRHIPFCHEIGFKQIILQSGTVGEVKMAIRSLSGSQGGLRRSSIDDQRTEGNSFKEC